MILTDVFSARAVAYRRTNNNSNTIPFLGENFFPAKKKMGIDLKWIKAHKGLGVALKPSAFDAMSTIRPRKGFTMLAEEMPLFRESMPIKEEDIANIMRVQDSNDPYLADVLSHIYDDADTLIDGADISAERMRMQLLAPINGNVQISIGIADNTIYAYDYDADHSWRAGHYLELLNDAKWSNPSTAKPLTDIKTATSKLRDLGYAPQYAIMTSKTLDYLVSSGQIKNAIITTSGVALEYVDEETTKEIFRRKTRLTPLIYDKKFTDYDGTEKSFFPDDYVTILSGVCGNLWYGCTPEERTLLMSKDVDVAMIKNAIAVATKTTYGPPVEYSTTVAQICLPSYEGMDGVFTIKVN